MNKKLSALIESHVSLVSKNEALLKQASDALESRSCHGLSISQLFFLREQIKNSLKQVPKTAEEITQFSELHSFVLAIEFNIRKLNQEIKL
jgi:hypothetical protein